MQISPIYSNQSNEFAHKSFKIRLPEILKEVIAKNDFPFSVVQDLEKLHSALVDNAALPAPKLTAPNAQTWLETFPKYANETWQNCEWFFGETYFFQLIIEAVRYWQTGQDPYQAVKREELEGQGIRQQIEAAQAITGTIEERLFLLLEMALWGNRVDLSLPDVQAHGQIAAEGDLLADERAFAVERFLKASGTVHLITDNFGTELAMDLALVDCLLQETIPVMMHLKMQPTYVSDATASDVLWMLKYFQEYPFAKRLLNALDEGRLQIAPDFFWNSPHFLDKLPPHLFQLFQNARLVILKGDANYRRAFFDTIWELNSPTQEIVNYLPAPLLCLRTLESDCLAGVSLEKAQAAESYSPKWRVMGKFGLIQYIPTRS